MSVLESNVKRSAKTVAVITILLMVTLIAVGSVITADALFAFNELGGSDTGKHIITPLFKVTFESRADMLSWGIYSAADACALIAILLTAYKVFHDISKTGAPFEAKHAERIRLISIFMLIDALALPIVCRTFIYLALRPERVAFGFNGTLAIVAVIFFCLSYIFRYGAALQRQADETL